MCDGGDEPLTLQRCRIRLPSGEPKCLEKVRLLQILLASLTFNYFEMQPNAAEPHDGRRRHTQVAEEEDWLFFSSSQSKSLVKNMPTFRKLLTSFRASKSLSSLCILNASFPSKFISFICIDQFEKSQKNVVQNFAQFCQQSPRSLSRANPAAPQGSADKFRLQFHFGFPAWIRQVPAAAAIRDQHCVGVLMKLRDLPSGPMLPPPLLPVWPCGCVCVCARV